MTYVPGTPPTLPLSSHILQATDILRRIEKFLNTDNDPDADTFLLCYSGHGSSDGGKWCCDDASYLTFEQVVGLWQVGSHSRCADAASLTIMCRAAPRGGTAIV
jgi:hypothetical protein